MKAQTLLTSLIAAVAAFFLSAARINHGLTNSELPTGPGLTPDESFNVAQGAYLTEAVLDHGPLLLTPAGARTVFGSPEYLPDHPPLGRLLLGTAHLLCRSLIAGADRSVLNVAAARLGSSFAFALTVFLLAEFTSRRYGGGTGLSAAVLLMLMPRVVGHSRIASLETATSLTWLAVFVCLFSWWTAERRPTARQSVITGICWGLLLLTKVQGILLPPLMTLWAIYRLGRKSLVPLSIVAVCGLSLCFAAWPWLWLDPVGHTLQYLGRATERPTLYVWYLGSRYADKSVPWHYPFVMFIAVTPLI
ncbi:MAG: glycosyltransferase family 39 protein, partial [Planctomycetaceae bacterium]|nr:glycosyltransferase family 39 protein [Planctomycetaceae bacterium]